MDIFEEVKTRANIVDVANLLGIKMDRNYKCLCPFHKERTPSFSISTSKNIFYCFGCGEKGDCISLASKILKISALESAKYLNEMLHLGVELKGNSRANKSYVNKYLEKKRAREEFDKWENKTFQLLCDNFHLLRKWRKIKDPENEQYIEALKNEDYIGYIIDEVFIYGTDKDKLFFKKNERKVVLDCEQRIRQFR